MKKVFVAALLALALALPLALSTGFAAEHEEDGVAITVTGVNYCLLCHLAEDEAADAEHNYAKLNALKVQSAVNADGEAMDALVGKTLHYLPTENVLPLLAEDAHRDQVVAVSGVLFENASTLAVESFEATEDEAGDEEGGDGGDDDWGWDDWDDLPVGSMSGQQIL